MVRMDLQQTMNGQKIGNTQEKIGLERTETVAVDDPPGRPLLG